jgi:glucose/arabinose dehydrogenase
VLHINPDGSIPTDNPFRDGINGAPEVWTKGLRNPQGITFDRETGSLFTVEHGAMGGDKINEQQPGRNYGWPYISYGKNYDGSQIGVGTEAAGFEQPYYYWDPSIAPGSLLIYDGEMFPEWKGNILVAALKLQLLARLERDSTGRFVHEECLLTDEFGRMRDVKVAPDGSLLVVTDDDDGILFRISRREQIEETTQNR